MALSPSVLGPLMQAKVDALSDEQKRDRAAVFHALAEAFCEHVTAAAVVTVTVVTTTPGVTPGPSAAPGTGTGTGTIS